MIWVLYFVNTVLIFCSFKLFKKVWFVSREIDGCIVILRWVYKAHLSDDEAKSLFIAVEFFFVFLILFMAWAVAALRLELFLSVTAVIFTGTATYLKIMRLNDPSEDPNLHKNGEVKYRGYAELYFSERTYDTICE